MNPVFWAADVSTDEVLLDGPEGRHAALVRRLRVGEAVDLVDGQGTRATGTVLSAARESLVVQVQTREHEAPQTPRLTLVQALVKGDRAELAVELATEIGVDRVVPWAAQRCIAKWTDKSLAKWRATAFEAAKQARRARFPEVTDLARTTDLATLGPLLVLHEEATQPLSQAELTDDVVLVVGPEGGIGPGELEAIGGTAVRLGTSVLRTSTAGAAGLAVVSARTGRW